MGNRELPDELRYIINVRNTLKEILDTLDEVIQELDSTIGDATVEFSKTLLQEGEL